MSPRDKASTFFGSRCASWDRCRHSVPIIAIAAAMVFCRGGLLAAAADEPAQQRRVLIVTGEDYPGHKWKLTTRVLTAQLEKDTRLQVEVLDDLTKLASAPLGNYAAVVLHFKNYDPKVPGRAGYDNLAKFAEQGGGLVLVHFACGAFQEFKGDFVKLAGRVWNPQFRGHDRYGTFAVELTKEDHPVTRGLDVFETTDELYTCLDGDTPITVLAEARSNVDKKLYPMAFVLTYGQGRVFHTPLGHDVDALTAQGAGDLIRRGTAWAARLDPAGETAAPSGKLPVRQESQL